MNFDLEYFSRTINEFLKKGTKRNNETLIDCETIYDLLKFLLDVDILSQRTYIKLSVATIELFLNRCSTSTFMLNSGNNELDNKYKILYINFLMKVDENIIYIKTSEYFNEQILNKFESQKKYFLD